MYSSGNKFLIPKQLDTWVVASCAPRGEIDVPGPTGIHPFLNILSDKLRALGMRVS